MTQPLASARYKYRLLPAASPSRSCSSTQTCHSVLSAQCKQCCTQWLALVSSMLVVWQLTMNGIHLTKQLRQHPLQNRPLEAARHLCTCVSSISPPDYLSTAAYSKAGCGVQQNADQVAIGRRLTTAEVLLTWNPGTDSRAHHTTSVICPSYRIEPVFVNSESYIASTADRTQGRGHARGQLPCRHRRFVLTTHLATNASSHRPQGQASQALH